MTATITKLGMSEEWFWNSLPRVVIAMIDEKKRIDLEEIKTQAYYIASFVWGNNPDELEENKEVAGIDKPVSENMLKGFNL